MDDDSRPGPLTGPRERQADEGPVCPVHGKMHLSVRGCCPRGQCQPAVYECPGFDGEGCARKVQVPGEAERAEERRQREAALARLGIRPGGG